MLPNISFVKGQGGLGRPLPGQDYISALIFYTPNLPNGFSNAKRTIAFYSAQDAINNGIFNDYSDATAAAATYTISNHGAAGNLVTVQVNDLDAIGQPQVTTLCIYTVLTADSTIDALGTSLQKAINAGTQTHGYTAVYSTNVITITAPNKFGIFLNSGSPLVVTITGTVAGTISQFSSGVASAFAFYYYHISEFFRVQPQGILYVGFFSVPGTYTFPEVVTVQDFSNGTLRQLGVFKDFGSAWSTADLAALQASALILDGVHKPLSSVLYSANLTGTIDITTLDDLSLQTAYKVSAVIGQDAGGQGWFLFKTIGKSISVLGAALGAVAFAKVSESIAWVAKFNISDGAENEVLAFSNGQLFNNSSISSSLDNILSFLNDKRYVFLRKFVGIDGSYFNDSPTAITAANDYAQIENNRTIDKATRGLYSSLLPSLNGPIKLNADGTITENTVAILTAQANTNLDAMVRNGELSDYEVLINPTQNILATSTLLIAVELVINGVARQIVVNIGFTPKLS